VKQFNINNCSIKSAGKKNADNNKDILELGEFKLAMRALRTAMAFVMLWNFSVMALEGFFLQNNFCVTEFLALSRQFQILIASETQF
jgi:hypothetical protein